MKEKFCKLLEIKSLVTLALTFVICVQVIRINVELPSEFLAAIVGSVFTYYFTRKDGGGNGNGV